MISRAAVLMLLLAGCRSHQPLPPLPDVSTTEFLPVVRHSVDDAMQKAKSAPDDAAAVGHLGMVLHAHEQLGAARQCYQRAALLAPRTFDWIYYLGVTSEGQAAENALRSALRLKDYLPAKLKLGEVLLAKGDAAGAVQVYRRLDHPAALFGLGRATNDAAYYEKALAAFPQYGAAIYALAQHYQRVGRREESQRLLAEYDRHKLSAPPVDDALMDAVRELNRSPSDLLRRSALLEEQGQLQGALDLQVQALELDPKLAQAHVNLISLYGRLGQPENAEEHYRQAIALNPQAHEAYYNFGVLCYRLKRRAEAHTAFGRALEINPGYAEAHNNLGVLLEEEGRLEEAADHFRKAIEQQPGHRLARFHLGRIYANQRRYPQAIEQFERAATPEDEATPTYLYALGATYARAGNFAKAESTLAAARDMAVSRGQTPLASAIERDLAKLRK